MRLLSYFWIIVAVFLVNNALIAGETSPAETKPEDSRIVNVEAKISQLATYIENVSNKHTEDLSNRQLEFASKIIDWSAMFFAALAVLLVIAGVIGIREFSKIRETEKEMKDMLDTVKSELSSIQKERQSLVLLTEEFVKINLYFSQGVTAYHDEKYLLAREFLYKVLEIDKQHMQAYLYVGKSLMMSGEKASAEDVFNRMSSLDRDSPYSHVGLALNCDLSDTPKAVIHCQKAFDLDPDNVGNLESIAFVYRNHNMIDTSFDVAMRSYVIEARSSNTFFIALIYDWRGEAENAAKYFNFCRYHSEMDIERARKAHWAYFKLAVIESLNGNHSLSERYLNRALNNNSSEQIIKFMRLDLEFISSGKGGENRVSGLRRTLDELLS